MLAANGFCVERNTLIFAVLVAAIAPVFLLRRARPELAWAMFVVLINLALAAGAVFLSFRYGSTIHICAYYLATVSVLWSACSLGVVRRTRDAVANVDIASRGSVHFISVAQMAAMTAGLTAATIVVFMIAVRGVYSALELWNGAPLYQNQVFQFGPEGYYVLASLGLATILGRCQDNDDRLNTVLFWLTVLAVVWTALLTPVFLPLEHGGFKRSGGTTVLTTGLSLTAAGFIAVQFWRLRTLHWRATWSDPESLLSRRAPWPGLYSSAAITGVLVGLLGCFQLADPPSFGSLTYRTGALLLFVSSLVCGVSLFSLLAFHWSANIADVAMGLVTLSIASLTWIAVPSEPHELAARYPMYFNALLFGLAGMVFFWVWLSLVWAQQIGEDGAWTAAGRLVPFCHRFAFLVGCLGVGVGVLMSIWPRLRPIGIADDSLGRTSAALSAHLFLIGVLLWSRRRVGRSSFGALMGLAVLSMLLFVVVRASPLASERVPATMVDAVQWAVRYSLG